MGVIFFLCWDNLARNSSLSFKRSVTVPSPSGGFPCLKRESNFICYGHISKISSFSVLMKTIAIYQCWLRIENLLNSYFSWQFIVHFPNLVFHFVSFNCWWVYLILYFISSYLRPFFFLFFIRFLNEFFSFISALLLPNLLFIFTILYYFPKPEFFF